MSSHKGFTLIEMLTTVSVAAILFAIAVPSFVRLTVSNTLVNYTNDLVSTVNFARSEAIRRGSTVVICSSTNGTSCSGADDTWSEGWIVFANSDNDSPAVVDAGETVLKVHEALTTGYTLGTDTTFAKEIDFDADGAANASGIFATCHNGDTVGAHAVVVTRLRPRIAKDTDGDHIPNNDAGDNIAGCTNP